MNFKQAAQVTATPTKTSWAQIFENKDSDTQAHFVCVLSLNSKEEQNLTELGMNSLEKISQDFFSSSETSVAQALKTSVENNLQAILEKAEVEIITGVFLDKFAYFTIWGKGRVCILREGKLLPVLIGREGGISSCSGKMSVGDIFALGTHEFFSVNDYEELARVLAPKDLNLAAESLTTQAHNSSLPGLAASIIEIGESQEVFEQIVEVQEKKSLKLPTLPKANFSFLKNAIARLPDHIKPRSEKKEERPRKTAVLVGSILIFVLIISVFFGIQQRQGKQSTQKLEEKLSQAQTLYNDSVVQKDINPGQARTLFAQAQGIMLELEKDYKDNESFKTLKSKIDTDAGIILGKITEEPKSFFDLTLIRSDAKAEELFIADTRLVALDQTGRRLLTVSTSGRETSAVGGQDKLPQAKSASFYGNRYLVLTDQGVKRIGRDGTTDSLIEADSDWGNAVKITTFGGNLYILTSDGKIWRYSDTGTAFANKAEWSKEAAGSSKDFAIDGFVWVLGEDGAIKRFSRGELASFQVKNLEQPLNNALALYTDEELDSVFILDRGRIVEFNKQTGEFEKEYTHEQINGVVDLVVSKADSKIYLLAQSKILELPLR